jgi:mannose-1-phosphate guanylyltransferase
LKALLLVGGLATRLKPLSLNRPKCLFPINNKPIIGHLLENLAEAGCTEAILAVNNLADKIKKQLGPEKYGIKLHYSLEKTPLGTGGPIKLAEKQLQDDDFIVLNGDILSFIDLNELMYIHRNSQAAATITLKLVDDPTRYGVVKFSSEDSIIEFVEKPRREDAPSNWINAGCYALSPNVLSQFPEGKFSIEREVFPKLAAINQLKGYKYYGEWVDIGVPTDYLWANKTLQTIKGERASSISTDTVIKEGSHVLDSIIWEKTVIGKNTAIIDSIIGAHCVIGDNVKITGAVIADNVEIKDNVTIPPGTKIWPDRTIEKSITQLNTVIK